MKKVILNDVITDLDGNVVETNIGRVFNEELGQWEDNIVPVTFGNIAYRVITGSRTKTDAEAIKLFALAEKINANLKLGTATEMELTDEEFDIVNGSIGVQALIVKARFLQMVEELNPTTDTSASGATE